MRRHRQLTDQQVHQIGWIQAADPGVTGGLRQIWVDTSSGPPYTLKQRNAADTGWDTLGGGGGAPSGAAGGDLAGTYPNPTVAKAAATFALTGGVIPTFTGSTVDYNPGAVSHIRWNGASAATLHGIVEGVAGQLMLLENATAAQVLTVPHESATEATPARRITSPEALDLTLQAGGVALLRYSGTSARWEVHARAYALAAGPDADDTVDAAGAAGTAGRGARAGHGHRLVTYTATPAAPAATGSAGTSGDAPARGSHVHPQAVPNVQIFTAGSGNWTKPAGARYVEVEVQGGGGGGGGAATTAAGEGAKGAGGAGGGYSRKSFAASALASTEPYQVGGAGAAGAAGDNNGGTGGASYFGAVGYRVQGDGGTGGEGSATVAGASRFANAGGAGGAASGGDINVPGGDGGSINFATSGHPIGGGGGEGVLGHGGRNTGLGAGAAGKAYGGGGDGGFNSVSSTQVAGGAGAVGVVIVRTYF